MPDLGYRPANSTVYLKFTTHAGSGAAVAPLSAYEAGDVILYKDGSATQRSSTSGWTMTSPFDSIVGLHQLAIDLSDNTDAGFYAAGSFYDVVLSADTETVDGQTVVRVIGTFSIGPVAANVQQWNGTAVASPTTAGIPTVALETTIRRATAQAGAAGTITLDSSASATDSIYLDDWVVIISGTGAGQARLISAYVGSTKVATVVPNWQTTPDNTSVFVVVPGAGVDLRLWRGSAPNTLTSSRVDVTVGAMQADVVTASAVATGAIDADAIAADAITAAKVADGTIDAATFAAGAITAAAIAADAIGASELAADAVTEIQSGLATSSAVAAISTTLGSAGAGLTGIPDSAGTTTLLSRLSSARAGYLDNLSAGAVALEASLQALITTIGASAAGVATAVWGAATRLLTAGTNIVLAKGTGVTGFNDLSAAQVNAEVDTALSDYDAPTKAELDAGLDALPTATENADALLKRDMSAVTGESARSPLNALRALRNRVAVATGTATIYKEDDTTAAWTAAVTTTAGDPVSEVDPS